jgi:hypothetical protein
LTAQITIGTILDGTIKNATKSVLDNPSEYPVFRETERFKMTKLHRERNRLQKNKKKLSDMSCSTDSIPESLRSLFLAMVYRRRFPLNAKFGLFVQPSDRLSLE